ncbi:hypothetical protein L1049_006507 [Liquidambar formosana]|uniref:Uncharacterized protein n=1 Tax=Liquidambar formosana TaxID=63359 RepID=A0AAP0WU81_LIQFO
MAPSGRIIHNLLHNSRRSLFSSSFSATRFALTAFPAQAPSLQIPSYSTSHLVGFSWTPNSTFASYVTLRFLNTRSSEDFDDTKEHPHQYETEGDREDIEWEEEDEVEPEIGDGGDGGGVVLQNVPWGERALCISHEVLLQFGDDMKLFAFKTTASRIHICEA